MKKVAFFCQPGMDTFIKPIIKALEGEYDCLLMHDIEKVWNDYREFQQFDIIWLEWCNQMAVDFCNTRMGKAVREGGCKVIVRLHSYEAFTDFPLKINWTVVDDLIFVADHIKEIVLEKLYGINNQRLKDQSGPIFSLNPHVIHNGVDLDKFEFKPRSHDSRWCTSILPFEKQKPYGFNIAYIGYLNGKKGPQLLLHAFHELVKHDFRYHLHIAGSFQDQIDVAYFNHMIPILGLQDNIHFDGWQEDINEWLSDKQQVICTSVLEGCPCGVMEAMACGLRPLIHDFVGATDFEGVPGIFPDEYVWTGIPEFIEMATKPFTEEESEWYSFWVEKHHSFKGHDYPSQMDKIRKVLK